MFFKRDYFWVGVVLVAGGFYYSWGNDASNGSARVNSLVEKKGSVPLPASSSASSPTKTAWVRPKNVPTPARVSENVVNAYKVRAVENGVFLAQEYRRRNPPNLGGSWDSYQGYFSPSQKDTCPMGDGWVRVDVSRILGDGKRVVSPLICSTYSKKRGCMSEEEFKGSEFSSVEGTCAKGLPFWLPEMRG